MAEEKKHTNSLENFKIKELATQEAPRPLVWLKQLSIKDMIRENSNLDIFGPQSRKIDMEQNENGKNEKIKKKEGYSRCQNSIKNYMGVSVKNDEKNYYISLENEREILLNLHLT